MVTRPGEESAAYFGPFPGVRQVEEAVLELCRGLGIRDCPAATPVFFADQLEILDGGRARPPLPAPGGGRCLAPCAGRPSARLYTERVRAARR